METSQYQVFKLQVVNRRRDEGYYKLGKQPSSYLGAKENSL